MNKKTNLTITILLFFLSVLIFEIYYLKNSNFEYTAKKQLFVQTVGLPDIAISTEANYIRHRSLGNVNQIFPDGLEHIEYFPSTFTINSNGLKK